MSNASGSFALDWLTRYKTAGFRIEVDGVSIRPHPENKAMEACRDLWAEIRGTDNVERWEAVEAEVRRQVDSVASWSDWPVRG